MKILKKTDIRKLIPHREPMLLIDEIYDIKKLFSATAVVNVKKDSFFVQGHFPGNPVMPGVLILEALAQASGILGFKTMNKTPEEGSIYVFAGVDKARFRKRVGPEDVIDLFSEVVNEKKGIWKFETRAEVEGQVVCSATIRCADRKTKCTFIPHQL